MFVDFIAFIQALTLLTFTKSEKRKYTIWIFRKKVYLNYRDTLELQ